MLEGIILNGPSMMDVASDLLAALDKKASQEK